MRQRARERRPLQIVRDVANKIVDFNIALDITENVVKHVNVDQAQGPRMMITCKVFMHSPLAFVVLRLLLCQADLLTKLMRSSWIFHLHQKTIDVYLLQHLPFFQYRFCILVAFQHVYTNYSLDYSAIDTAHRRRCRNNSSRIECTCMGSHSILRNKFYIWKEVLH